MEIGIDVKGKCKDLQINSGALAVLTHLSYIPIPFPPKTGTQLHVLPHPRQCLRESFVSTLICGQCLKFEGTGQDPHAEHVWDVNYARALVQTYGYSTRVRGIFSMLGLHSASPWTHFYLVTLISISWARLLGEFLENSLLQLLQLVVSPKG